MGSCKTKGRKSFNENFDSNQIESNKNKDTKKPNQINKNIINQEIPKEDERFSDMPIWEGKKHN